MGGRVESEAAERVCETEEVVESVATMAPGMVRADLSENQMGVVRERRRPVGIKIESRTRDCVE